MSIVGRQTSKSDIPGELLSAVIKVCSDCRVAQRRGCKPAEQGDRGGVPEEGRGAGYGKATGS